MRDVLSIAKYEYKMQIRNKAFWIVLLFASIFSIWEQFPSNENLRRLGGLTDHSYIASRSLTLMGVFLMFGCVFLIGNRINIDIKKKISEVLFSTPISKASYICGKFFGNYLVSLTIGTIFVVINGVTQALFNPAPFEIVPYILSIIFIVIPSMLFVVSLSLAIPVLIDIRLLYASFSVYFMYCIIAIPDSYELPFYWIIGDTRKLVYSVDGFPIPYQSALLNIIFLIGVGMLSLLLLGLKRCFWRGNCD